MTKLLATPQVRRSITDIIFVTAEFYGVSPSEILGPSRSKTLVEARAVAVALCRDLTPSSYPELGAAFGRDHTTIIYQVKSIVGRMMEDEPLARSIAICRERCLVTIRARRMV